MLLRWRGRDGTGRLDAEDGWTSEKLLDALALAVGIERSRLKALSGFPPKPVSTALSEPISQQFRPGDLLTVEESPAPTPSTPTTAAESVPIKTSSARTAPAAAVAAQPQAQPPPAAGSAFVAELGAPMVRRRVPDDNSCLFRSVALVLQNGRSPGELRQLIADAVAADTSFYGEVVLGGRSNAGYQSWIRSDTAWGGAIELSILARQFSTELAAFDIQTGRMDCYGEDEGYKERGFLLYDGIHYDAMALAFGGEDNDAADVTMFDGRNEAVTAAARALALSERAAEKFTDTQKFLLTCDVCGTRLQGEDAATQHAERTGHSSFSES